MRNEVRELQMLGHFPSEDDDSEDAQDVVEKYERLILSIEEPMTDEEAVILAGIFGNDGFWGLGWTLLHLIETTPNWPIEECLENVGNEWIEMLKDRADRWRAAGYPPRSFYTEAGLPDPRTNRKLP